MPIRPAHATDIARIRAIYNQAVRERTATCDEDEKSVAERTQWFAQFNAKYPIFVLEESGEVIGYGCLLQYSTKSGYRFAVEDSLYLDREHRGRGHGRRLLTHLIEAARARDYRYLEARVFAHNPASIHLHEALGFTRVGVQRDIACLDGKWYSNVILSLRLEPKENDYVSQ